MNRKDIIDFATFKELDSLLSWMETYMRDASEEQLESYLGIKDELIRRMTRLNEEHIGFWRIYSEMMERGHSAKAADLYVNRAREAWNGPKGDEE